MTLSWQQKMELYEQGYTVLREVIPQAMVDGVLRAINHSVGEGLPQEEIVLMRARSYCKELQGTPLLTDLIMGTPVFALAESALGKGKLQPAGGGQVALRFPNMKDGPPPKLHGHLDGMPSPHNGVPNDGKFHNFTMLAVCLLSELERPYAGNFSVWPGTHRMNEAFFRRHGPEYLLTQGMPRYEYPEPVQLQGRPGDVVLTHYSVIHTAAPNLSPHVRYAVIFRLNHVRRTNGGNYGDVLSDLWLEWDGIREIVPADAKPPEIRELAEPARKEAVTYE